MSAESREFSRITRQLSVRVSAAERLFTAATRNISMRGVFLMCSERVADGASVELEIMLDDDDSSPRIIANGHVVRQTASGLAVQFDELVGPESYAVLRQLLMYNAVDPAQIERECDEHLGLMRAPQRTSSHSPPY